MYPVDIRITMPERSNRLWAVPLVGNFVKLIILIPHLFILSVLGDVIILLQLVLWIPVLFSGRYPQWGHDLITGYIAWWVRVAIYFFGLTDRYPPFQLGGSYDGSRVDAQP